MKLKILSLVFDMQNQKRLRLMSYVFCLLPFALFLGCYGGESVKIKVLMDSKIDMQKYRTIAVMDFIDTRDNSVTDQGTILARMVRKQLRRSKEFQVLDEKDIDLVLDEEIDKDRIEEPEFLISISDQLEADALIVGTFDFYQMDQPVSYMVERYSPKTRRYNPETRTYVQRVNRLALHIKVVNGSTGKTILDYTPASRDVPELRSIWGQALSGSGSSPATLRGIAAGPLTAFVLNLVPHYQHEQRKLARL